MFDADVALDGNYKDFLRSSKVLSVHLFLLKVNFIEISLLFLISF